MEITHAILALLVLAGLCAVLFFGLCEGAFLSLLEDRQAPDPPPTEPFEGDARAMRHGIELGRLAALSTVASSSWMTLYGSGTTLLQTAALALITVVAIVLDRVGRHLGERRPEVWAVRANPWLRVWMSICGLIVRPLARLDRTERPIFDTESARRSEPGEMPLAVFDLRSTTVREVMTPRPDIVAVEADRSWRDAIDVVRRSGRSRIPVYDGEVDRIEGVLYAKDLVAFEHGLADPPASLDELWWEPTFVPEAKRIDGLLREFQRDRIHLAIVVDEYGGTAGVVTLEDILEEVVGEIRDEHDREGPLVEPLGDDVYRVDGRLDVDDFNELTRSDLDATGADTMAGLVARELGRIAEGGEEVAVEEWTFRVDAVDGNRILGITASRGEP